MADKNQNAGVKKQGKTPLHEGYQPRKRGYQPYAANTEVQPPKGGTGEVSANQPNSTGNHEKPDEGSPSD